mmetsp:Transcript_76446/g.203013  ORF Transcript_76446/g.203013 Transcript_76446/m.203013 type:complete len:180 (-) Transcript_76446:119-658(-)|eukprot:CAMPEP_0171220416 /NCGR_PEP_ID=MMETSP0790-20130122/34227_1 /TAXON_ID=2925 /ORGANISM="Alexandrium catenella, Strain OF101" /LENGTH=179 /DNA_ID=CAMNT_0011686311 /DNA_START=80 /DNA_END=619 /DNA_ORIENTATION=+
MKSACAALLLSVLAAVVDASTMVTKKCQGHLCENPEFPLLDWDPETRTCHCRAHPCHHDQNADGNRVVHSCGRDKPFLSFSYTVDKQLQCDCLGNSGAGSVYISRELCAGHTCEDGQNLILDYDESTGKCVCSRHPCMDDNGVQHSCPDAKFPVLAYHYEDSGKLVCKCNMNYKAKDEL